MLDVNTLKRLACHEDFVTSDETWKDSNLCDRTTHAVTSDDIPSGLALKTENGCENVTDSILETNRRLSKVENEKGMGMPTGSSIYSWQVESFPYRNLGGNTLVIGLYAGYRVKLEGFYNGSIVVTSQASVVTNSSSEPTIAASGCTADILIYNSKFKAEGGCKTVVSVSNCHRMNLDGCKFTSASNDAACVICDGSTVVLKNCDAGSLTPLKTSAAFSLDKNSILVEEMKEKLDGFESRISSVSSMVSQLMKNILAAGETDGVSYVLYNDSTNDYKGTLMMWRHGVSPTLFTSFEKGTQSTWNDSREPMEVYDFRLPYSYANTNYQTFISLGNPITLEGTEACPLMTLDETTNEYHFADHADVWASENDSTIDAMLMETTIISDFYKTSRTGALDYDRKQKFVNRFFASSHGQFPIKRSSTSAGFDPGKKITRKGTVGGSWNTTRKAYEYTMASGYTMDFITIGEVSEESYNQLVTE